MKDIYELLNESNIDIGGNEEMEVSEIERERGKKKLLSSIKKKKRISRKIAVAASVALIMGMSSVFVAKPTWASSIPIIGDLIQNKLININGKYIDYIQAVGQTKSDQGIDITFESAIADRNVLNLSFIVKNNNESIKDNVIDALVIPTALKVNGKSVGTGAGGSYEVIDENTVKVLKNISWEHGKLEDHLNIDIEISEMYGKNGNWDVSFALDTKEVEKNTYVEKLDKVINTEDIDYKLEEVIITPLTTRVNYSFKGGVKNKNTTKEVVEEFGIVSEELGFIVFDEDGNEVRFNGAGLTGKGNKYKGYWESINSNDIEKLNIIPLYYKKYREAEEKLLPTKVNIEEFSNVNIKINEDMSMDVYNCIIEGEYAVFEYSYRYLDKVVNHYQFPNIYVNVDGKFYSQLEGSKPDVEMDRLYKKYDTSSNKKIVKIGNSKDIEIGAYDGSSIEFLKEQAFTVTKK